MKNKLKIALAMAAASVGMVFAASQAYAALTLGSTSVASDAALTLQGAAASTWSTSAGALTVDSAAGLNLGTSAASGVTVGSTTGATSLTLRSGTGNISVSPIAAATITVGNTAQTGAITVASSSAANTLNLGVGSGATAINIGNTGATTTVTGVLAVTNSPAASQTLENNSQTIALTTDSTFVAGTNVTYSGGRGSSALKLTGTWSATAGGYSNIYSLVTASGALNDANGGPVGVKGVTLTSAALTAGNIYGGQFIAKHNHATNKAANAAPFIGVEGVVTQGDAGQIGTAIGGSFAIHIPDGAAVFDAGAVHRGVQITMDGGASGNAPSESTGLAIWNMAGSHDNAIKVIGAFTNDITLQNSETIDNTANGTIRLTGNLKVTGATTFGNSTTTGVLLGAGSSGIANAYSAGATAGTTKAMSFYIKSTSVLASDALEGLYINTYHGGDAAVAAPSGEAARFRAYLTGDAAGSIALVGSHSTVEMAAGSTNTGLTAGSRGNLVLPDGTIGTSGTFAGMQAELYSGGASTDVTGVTSVSPLRIVIDGVAGFTANKWTNVPVMRIDVPSSLVGASGSVLDTTPTQVTPSAKVKININGTDYWILLVAAD